MTTPTTPTAEQIAAIRRRYEAANVSDDPGLLGPRMALLRKDDYDEEMVQLWAHSPIDIPLLLNAVAALGSKLAEAEHREHRRDDVWGQCASCARPIQCRDGMVETGGKTYHPICAVTVRAEAAEEKLAAAERRANEAEAVAHPCCVCVPVIGDATPPAKDAGETRTPICGCTGGNGHRADCQLVIDGVVAAPAVSPTNDARDAGETRRYFNSDDRWLAYWVVIGGTPYYVESGRLDASRRNIRELEDEFSEFPASHAERRIVESGYQLVAAPAAKGAVTP